LLFVLPFFLYQSILQVKLNMRFFCRRIFHDWRSRTKLVWRGKKYLYPSPIVSLHVGHERSISLLFIEYPWERRIKQRERVTGQRVIYSSPPINDNDLHMDQWLSHVFHFFLYKLMCIPVNKLHNFVVERRDSRYRIIFHTEVTVRLASLNEK
jgi:hypothetical protein